MSDADKACLEQHLQTGGAALVAMASEDEVAATSTELSSLGGTVEDFAVPEETMEQAEAAEDVQPAEEADDTGQ